MQDASWGVENREGLLMYLERTCSTMERRKGEMVNKQGHGSTAFLPNAPKLFFQVLYALWGNNIEPFCMHEERYSCWIHL